MKIAVIGSKGLPPKEGGIEHHCAEIYPRMVAQGHSVDLFARSFYTGSHDSGQFEYKGVRVFPLPCPNVFGLDVMVSSAMASLLLCGKHYDIVHFHALGPALFSWLPYLTSSAKVIVTCHGLDWQRAKWGKLAKNSILLGERMAVLCAHEIISVSEALQFYFLKTYGRGSTYVPNAPAIYAKSDDSFTWGKSLGLERGRYIVFLGRLVPEKCPELAIRAFQALQPPGWKLVLVGGCTSPSYRAQLLNLTNNNPNILFTGEITGGKLAEIVRGAGLSILPSNLEGLPMAMLEAMEEGIPIVASDIPPHRQLLGNNRGVLFRTGDLSSCIQKLDWAIDNPYDLKVMAEQAKEHIRLNYNWDRITATLLRLYEGTLNPPYYEILCNLREVFAYPRTFSDVSSSQIDMSLLG
jgi:glycosyltransferase involved in cell wall biosynthesis